MNDVGWFIISGFDGLIIKCKDSVLDVFVIDMFYVFKESLVVFNLSNDNLNGNIWCNVVIVVLIMIVLVVLIWGFVKVY